MRLFLVIFPYLSLLTSTWVERCSGAFFTQSSNIGQRYHCRTFSMQGLDAVAADDSNNSRSPADRQKSILRQKLTEHFERLTSEDARSRAPPSNVHELEMYLVGEKFMEEDSYWKRIVRTDSFEATLEKGCLYRPKVVEDLYLTVQHALNGKVPQGVMVKGPEGIGKSHTLVNLVRKLLYGTDGKYLVTYIPDCTFFLSENSLLRAICSSFGSNPREIKCGDVSEPEFFLDFIAEIDSILQDMDKQWILIYDHIDRIFARPEFENVKDLDSTSFPFSLIRDAMNHRRITSIISAPTNSAIAYRERHTSRFIEYFHPRSMDWNELKMLYPSIAFKNQNKVLEMTDGVPLQVSKLIDVDYDAFNLSYQCMTLGGIKKSAITRLLGVAGDKVHHYDKKHSMPRQGESCYFDPVYPLVSVVYYMYFWDDMMWFVGGKEKALLKFCAKPDSK